MKRIISFVLLCTLFVFAGCGEAQDPAENDASVSFQVLDGVSGMPVEGVRIVLPEYKKELLTGSDGKTEAAEIAVLYDTHFADIHLQEYGTFTVLAYKEGYSDYALFFAQIRENQERNIKVYMFMKDTPMSNGAPLATVESPEKEWVKELVEQYR